FRSMNAVRTFISLRQQIESIKPNNEKRKNETKNEKMKQLISNILTNYSMNVYLLIHFIANMFDENITSFSESPINVDEAVLKENVLHSLWFYICTNFQNW